MTKKKKQNELNKWEIFVKENFNSGYWFYTDWGMICFDREFYEKVTHKTISFRRFLNLQKESQESPEFRSILETCWQIDDLCPEVKGTISVKKENKVCFYKLDVTCCDMGFNCYEGVADHVWIKSKEFEKFSVGDKVRFTAEVKPYIKHGHGLMFNYGLENPENIEKIEDYKQPTEDELLMQKARNIVCETCLFNSHCNGLCCLAEPKEVAAKRKYFFYLLKGILPVEKED